MAIISAVTVLFDFVVSLRVFIRVAAGLLWGRCYTLKLSLVFLLAAPCVLDANMSNMSVDVWQSYYLGALLPCTFTFRWSVNECHRPHILLRPVLLLNGSSKRRVVCRVAWVFGVFQNRMDITLCFGWQRLIHCQRISRHVTRGEILPQLIAIVIVALLDGCSMILLYFSLNSTDLLLDEINLLVHKFPPSAIAALLLSRDIITILMHRLYLWRWISDVARCFIISAIAQSGTDSISHT